MSPTPIRCRGAWKINNRATEPDRWLDEMGFFRKHTARDPSCLFRAVSENVYNTQRYFHRVRLDCVKFMESKKQLFEGSLNCPIENYLKEMSSPSEWGGLIEVLAMSHLYRRDFLIFEANKGPQTKISNGYSNTIFLFYSPETKHFDAVYTKLYINMSSFCQSLVYEILYDGVFHLKDLPYAVDKMLHEKNPIDNIEYFMSDNVERRKKQKERAKIYIEARNNNDKDKSTITLKCKHHTDDLERASLLKESLSIFVFNRSLIQLENICMNCLNVNSAKDLLDNGITPFPYKVAKALDPDIYRNIEFDVWSEMRRELRYGARFSDGTTLQVGVKCLCKLNPDQTVPYHCHIQEMTDGGPCLVFIEELGEKRVINYEQLEPLPIDEIRPWAPPYRFSRTNSNILTLSQMLQQIGNITRKCGLGKSRIKPKANNEYVPKNIEISPTKDDKLKINWKDESKADLVSEINKPYGDAGMDYNANMDYSTFQHLDLFNFEPMPVEIVGLPLMVDCRPAAGANPEVPPQPTNETHHNQQGGDVNSGGAPLPPVQRASTPATNNVNNYAGVCPGNVVPQFPKGGLVWVPPPVNPHVYKSMLPSGADLPMNDIATLRFYFNLGVECMWSTYGAPPAPYSAHPALHHQPHQAPPRYPPRDIAQEMQQMSIHERPVMPHNGPEGHNKHKSIPDKGINNKGNSQRPLVGPRFKRGNQDGNQNSNHNNQNKGHNNNTMGNKGPNNRRNIGAPLGAGGAVVPAVAAVGGGAGGAVAPAEEGGEVGVGYTYVPYPPLYPPIYYPLEHDPGMMGMMGGYVGYEEGGEYLQYVPPYPPPPAHRHPHSNHH